MRYGFIIPKGDPRTVADLAREVEEAGWDGAFYYDAIHVGEGWEIYDPWVVMAAMAMLTRRVRIGAMLTPPARRRPWKLAREALTLDHLSGGRLVLPRGPPPIGQDRRLLLLPLAGVFEDLEDLLDQGLALVGREVSGVDGLFI